MLLALDVSNAATAIGLFDGEALHASWRLTSDLQRTSDEYGLLLCSLLDRAGVQRSAVHHAVLGSVVPRLSVTLVEACRRYLGLSPLVVGPGVRTGVRILTDQPREVGADRVANALAAFRRLGGPAIVLDFGTATTLDAISREGDYLGAVIAPGVLLAAQALARQTAQLPGVDVVRPRQVIGKSTVAAVQAGLVFGYAAMVEGLVARVWRELGDEGRVVATGEFAEVIAAETGVVDVVDPHLTLHGLRLIHDLNRR
ncbi:MAG TPA: type III pantothenate kinase [Chloroflexota bacterium]